MRPVFTAEEMRELVTDVADPRLADEVAARAALWPEGTRGLTAASLAFHDAALADAGFTETAVVCKTSRSVSCSPSPET